MKFILKKILCKNNTGDKKFAGFTLVEFVVSISIFAFMTALLVAKYGTFNQSVLLTNLAYDVAVTIRTAQSYGLSVRAVEGAVSGEVFSRPYGVYFDSATGNNTSFILYSDSRLKNDYISDPSYSATGASTVSTSQIKRGAVISRLCAGSNDLSCSSGTSLSISFKRPDPSAKICLGNTCGKTYAEIEIRGTDGSTRLVTVRENGQISVKN